MKNSFYTFIIMCVCLFACNNSEKQKEQELRERELIAKEKELALQENGGIAVDNSATIPSDPNYKPTKTQPKPSNGTYKMHSPCSFSVSLPENYDLQNMDPSEKSPDYCDFHVKDADGAEIIQIGSLNRGRFEFDNIADAYKGAIQKSGLDITYKVQKENWFVISGFDKKNHNVVYWKRVLGGNFVSDLHIEFPESKRAQIEPHIAKISKSFTSQ
jgi:hypothetical protein